MHSTLLNHRTIRKYKTDIISDEILNRIFIAGTRASTTGNMQVYSIINTQSEALKKELAPLHFNQKMVLDAPSVVTFCADFNRFKRWCKINNAQPGYDNFLSFITAAIDAILVAQNVAIAAESEGLGICYLGTTIYNADKIIELLDLPKGVIPITTLTIGWPDETPGLTDRLPLEAVLHNEKYTDYTDELIKKYYFEKENLSSNKQYIVDNGKSTLAQVFTDVRYKKADNEFFSEKLRTLLIAQGYL